MLSICSFIMFSGVPALRVTMYWHVLADLRALVIVAYFGRSTLHSLMEARQEPTFFLLTAAARAVCSHLHKIWSS